MTLRLAIVGRPNVGKSTLFNRLAQKKLAIVDDRPGVTRDWREAPGYLLDETLTIIDTAGLEEAFDDTIPARMRQQTDAALKTADAVLFVTSAQEGITPMDKHFANWLRAQGKPIIHAINKCEDENSAITAVGEAYGLGLGDPVAISAAHGFGFDDLYHTLAPYIEQFRGDTDDTDEYGSRGMDWDRLDAIEGDEDFDFTALEAPEDETKPVKLAIVGRPNVGKSTLMNTILGEHRVMTGPEAGITRDSVAVAWSFQGRTMRLVDTAGMRKRAKVQGKLERLSVDESLRAIRLAHVCLLVIDGTLGIDKQDLTIAKHITDEGRALVIVVNKWDAVEDKTAVRAELEEVIRHSVSQVPDVPVLYISALSRKKIDPLMEAVLSVFDVWGRRVPTSPLNRWVQARYDQNPPPLWSGRPNRLRYITQIKNKPPTFALWCSKPEALPDHYLRYLMNGLRADFDLPGIPIRFHLRTSKNPYV